MLRYGTYYVFGLLSRIACSSLLSWPTDAWLLVGLKLTITQHDTAKQLTCYILTLEAHVPTYLILGHNKDRQSGCALPTTGLRLLAATYLRGTPVRQELSARYQVGAKHHNLIIHKRVKLRHRFMLYTFPSIQKLMAPRKSDPIIIVGAGVFGLTTALHLAHQGYSDVHVFDKQPYHDNGYAFSAGCDAASADENKILRASYGSGKLYQDLAFEAMKHWEAWNQQISNSTDLPQGLSTSDKLWDNCGFLRIGNTFDEHEVETQANFPADIKHTQYRVNDPQRVQDATKDGIPKEKLDPFNRQVRGLQTDGMLDMTAGFVLASKACSFALHLCRKAGVSFHLGAGRGEFRSFIKRDDTVIGITTVDGTSHTASLVVVAAGGWTPSLVPQADRLLETTAGSIVIFQLPKERKDLWDKYDPERFPVWSWKMDTYRPGTSTGGLYGLPRTPDGIVKFGFRGAKWTNYTWKTTEVGRKVSYPKTDLDQIPEKAFDTVRAFCKENMQDLLGLDMYRGRLCWYTDSVDNSFLIDQVPGSPGLMVAGGGSGHGFKFLPVLGKHVVDVIEDKDTEYTRLFSWRDVPSHANGLEEGPSGWRTLDKQALVGKREWRL